MFILKVLLFCLPPVVLLGWFYKAKVLTPLKLGAVVALFSGAILSYVHFQTTGIYGLVLALIGLVLYGESVREDCFKEMRRLAEADPWEGEEVVPEETGSGV